MTEISPEDRRLAQHLAKAIGGAPAITRYWDDDAKSYVDILSAEDRPWEDATSFATVGLYHTPLIHNGEEYLAPNAEGEVAPVRVEIVGACRSTFAGRPQSKRKGKKSTFANV